MEDEADGESSSEKSSGGKAEAPVAGHLHLAY
jgi:hypothetical protein